MSRLSRINTTHILPIDGDPHWRRFKVVTPQPDPSGDSLAFIPFTSGTTGDPKGVMQTSGSLMSSYFARYRFSSYSAGDRVACNIFFPWEFLRPLLKGGTVYVVPDDVVFLPRALAAFIAEHRISEILFTPSLLQAVLNSADHKLLRAQLSSLRVVWLNGEVVPTSLLKLALDVLPDSARVFNTYSISETHDVCTVDLTDLPLDGLDVCPVGLPMDGVKVRVLPEGAFTLASQGAGELFIGGRGLARGYLKSPDLDAKSFVRWDGERYYATGDLARIDSRGMTTIIGRNDSMVKIRGYSVYLGAIEETLRKQCDAADAAVLAETVDETNKRLVAYVVPAPQAAWKVDARSGTSKDLRTMLERYLPLYMVPSHFVQLEALPINQQTGKLERKALPATRAARPKAEERPPLPKHATAEERRQALRDLWGEVLNVDSDSLQDDWDFFDVGGHSLAGMEITLGIERLFAIELSGAEVYEYPTIGELAAYLQHRGPNMESRASLAEDSILPPEISPKGAVRTTRLSEASAVLVTGATGFLGAFLLDELLRTTGQDTRFYCLVRDRTPGRGRRGNRVLETLKFYGLAGQSEEARIIPVAGDLTQPCLGLKDAEYRELADRIDLVFHCAASVNYAYPYSAARSHTVGGTLEVLRFACTATTKPVQYISSNGIFPGGDDAPYLEDNHIDGFSRQDGGRLQPGQVGCRTARVAGRISRPAGLPLPPRQHRPPQCHGRRQSQRLPDVDHQGLCPPGLCSPRAGLVLRNDPCRLPGNRHHEDCRRCQSLRQRLQRRPTAPRSRRPRFRPHGEPTDTCRNGFLIGEWKARLEEMADREEDMESKVLARSMESVEPYLADTSAYDISRFTNALSEIGLTMPAVDVDYVTSFLRK